MELSELCRRIGADMELLTERMGGNEQLVRRFLCGLPRDGAFDAMRRAMEEQNYPAAGTAAVTLRQFTECLELPVLAGLCEGLLEALRGGGAEPQECFSRLSDEYMRVVGEISRFVSGDDE